MTRGHSSCWGSAIPLAVALSLVPLVFVQARPQRSEEEQLPPARQVRLYGIVTQPDGRPAANVELDFEQPATSPGPVITGADGTYAIVLDFRGPGWFEAWVDGVVRTKPFLVTPGECRLDLKLLPVPVLSGIIRLPDGQPAANCTFEVGGDVQWRVAGAGGGRRAGRRLFTAETDEAGRYRIVLAHGQGAEYHLFLSDPDKGCAELQVKLDMDHPEIVKDIALQHGGTVRGAIYGYPGRTPVEGAEVVVGRGIDDIRPEWSCTVTSDAEGRFEASVLPPGEYRVRARKEGWGQMWVENPKLQVGEGWGQSTEIALGREFEITGRVFAPDGTPVANADLGTLELRTDAQGRYLYRHGVRSGFYGRTYVERYVILKARVAGVGVSAPVQIDFMQWSPQPVDIHLFKPKNIRGEIRYEDGQRLSTRGGVRLIPVHVGGHREKPADPAAYYDEERSAYGEVQDGRFTFEEVIPGDYLIEVWGSSIYQREQQYATAFPVSVPPDGKPISVVVPVTQKPRFQGRLIGLPLHVPGTDKPYTLFCTGQIAGGGSCPRNVHAERQGDDGYIAWTSAMNTGRFDIVMRAVPPSPALGESLVSNILRDVEFVEGAALEGLDFRFTSGASVSGRVLSADSQTPMADTAVRIRPLSRDALMVVPYDVCGRNRFGYADYLEAGTDESGRFQMTGLLAGEYEVQVRWQREWYGKPPTLRLRLAENERKRDLVFQASKTWP